jgi:hypothetical protein
VGFVTGVIGAGVATPAFGQAPAVVRSTVKPVAISSANGNRFKNDGAVICVQEAFRRITGEGVRCAWLVSVGTKHLSSSRQQCAAAAWCRLAGRSGLSRQGAVVRRRAQNALITVLAPNDLELHWTLRVQLCPIKPLDKTANANGQHDRIRSSGRILRARPLVDSNINLNDGCRASISRGWQARQAGREFTGLAVGARPKPEVQVAEFPAPKLPFDSEPRAS